MVELAYNADFHSQHWLKQYCEHSKQNSILRGKSRAHQHAIAYVSIRPGLWT